MVAVWPAAEARPDGGRTGDWRRGEYPHVISKGKGAGRGGWWVDSAATR
jgi:hypothetical protein